MTQEELEAAQYALQFDVRRSVRYHHRRRSVYETFNLFSTASALVLGSGAFYAMFADHDTRILGILGAIVTVVSTIDIVVSSSAKSRLHADLARQFIALEREIVLVGDYDEAKLRDFTARRLQIELDEPPVLRVLDALCHNELCRATNADKLDYVRIYWWQRAIANYGDIEPESLKTYRQLAAENALAQSPSGNS